MKLTLFAIGSALMALAVGMPVQGHHVPPYPDCVGDVTVIADGAETIYIDDRSGGEPGVIDHWVYVESGVLAGLQPGGNSILGAGVSSDHCRWPVVAERDILIF